MSLVCEDRLDGVRALTIMPGGKFIHAGTRVVCTLRGSEQRCCRETDALRRRETRAEPNAFVPDMGLPRWSSDAATS